MVWPVIIVGVVLLSTCASTSPLEPLVGIINGDVVPNGGAPYQVSLQNSQGQPNCGGSILNANWILTAAHCLNWSKDFNASQIYVRYNFLNLSSPQVDRVQVAKFYQTGWNHMTINNDIALLHLATPLKLGSKNAKPIELVPEGYQPPAGAMAIVSGWGLRENNANEPSQLLRKVSLAVMAHQKCQEVFKGIHITDGMLCAGGDGVHDACHMDSGGPAVIDGKLAGVVSFGPATCATKGMPTVYTNVAHYRKWIHEITGL